MLQVALSEATGPVWMTVVSVILMTLAASAILYLVARLLWWPGSAKPPGRVSGHTGSPTFLFEDRTLVDATPSARRLLRGSGDVGDDWDRALSVLSPQFPDLSAAGLRPQSDVRLPSATDDSTSLEIDCWDNMVRLSVLTRNDAETDLHPAALAAMEEEIEMLRVAGDDAPVLIWKEDCAGKVVWANRAYLELADQLASAEGAPRSWPLPRMFGASIVPKAPGLQSFPRVALPMPDSDVSLWFDVIGQMRGSDIIYHATDVTAIVSAENQRAEFLQTITKTFAHLSIGLAIFDRRRKLVIFNPALLDLTSLPVGFLTGHPHIRSFLDRLRDQNMIPEPANYHTWREQMAALEVAAERGSYRESWMLPSGQTYRVTGRPHPDGAIAFTFEDITAEVSLTRGFRAELDIAQGVVDTLDEAIAVFSPAGTMWMSNSAYKNVWGQSADSFDEIGLTDQISLWRETAAPNDIWREVRSLTDPLAEKRPITTEIRQRDGRLLRCRFRPLPGGALFAGFLPVTAMARPAATLEPAALPHTGAGEIVKGGQARRA